MKRYSIKSLTPALSTALIALAMPTSVLALSADKGKEIVEPFYEFLSNPQSEQHASNARKSFHPQWRSFYSNTGYKTLDETIGSIKYFGKLIPDLSWEIKDVKASGNSIVVRGEATGTPAGDFFGVPHTGKSFKIMSIDIHTIEEGKVVESHHIEDWSGAIKQLTAN